MLRYAQESRHVHFNLLTNRIERPCEDSCCSSLETHLSCLSFIMTKYYHAQSHGSHVQMTETPEATANKNEKADTGLFPIFRLPSKTGPLKYKLIKE